MEKLYHIVFLNKDFNDIEILNSNLEKVQEFTLLEHQH